MGDVRQAGALTTAPWRSPPPSSCARAWAWSRRARRRPPRPPAQPPRRAQQQAQRAQRETDEGRHSADQQQQQPGSAHSWTPTTFAAQVADGLTAAALGEAPQLPGAATVCLPAANWPEAEALLTQRPEWETGGSTSASSSAGSSVGEEGWPDPFQREWLLTCGSGGAQPEESAAAAAAEVAAQHHKPSSPRNSSGCGWPAPWEPVIAAGHRFYARALPSEVRIATALAPEVAL